MPNYHSNNPIEVPWYPRRNTTWKIHHSFLPSADSHNIGRWVVMTYIHDISIWLYCITMINSARSWYIIIVYHCCTLKDSNYLILFGDIVSINDSIASPCITISTMFYHVLSSIPILYHFHSIYIHLHIKWCTIAVCNF